MCPTRLAVVRRRQNEVVPRFIPSSVFHLRYAGAFSLKDYIEERAIEAANYIIDTRATVRQTADKMGISKSTVHKDITERLVRIRPMLAAQARVVLDANKAERHIRGGLATREKYLHVTKF